MTQRTARINTLIAAIFSICLLSACGSSPQPKAYFEAPEEPEPTSTITYDHTYTTSTTYIHDIEDPNQRTPQNIANAMKEKQRYTDVQAEPNGDITVTVTKKQRQKLITHDNDNIKGFTKTFNDSNPDYRYEYDDTTHTMSLWIDRHASPLTISIVALAPMYGDLYYINGGTGPWTITTKMYGCHTGHLYQQFTNHDGKQTIDTNNWPE